LVEEALRAASLILPPRPNNAANLVILVHSGVVLFYGVLHVERSLASCTR
jgi:hypothetical protein